MITKEQQQAIEEAAYDFAVSTLGICIDVIDSECYTTYLSGMQEVLTNPLKYGLKPIEE